MGQNVYDGLLSVFVSPQITLYGGHFEFWMNYMYLRVLMFIAIDSFTTK